jgi:hypothetical protein
LMAIPGVYGFVQVENLSLSPPPTPCSFRVK